MSKNEAPEQLSTIDRKTCRRVRERALLLLDAYAHVSSAEKLKNAIAVDLGMLLLREEPPLVLTLELRERIALEVIAQKDWQPSPKTEETPSRKKSKAYPLIAYNAYPGFYALGGPNERALCSGDRVEIEVEVGLWIKATIRKNRTREGAGSVVTDGGSPGSNYYAQTDNGRFLGLCIGMRVKLVEE